MQDFTSQPAILRLSVHAQLSDDKEQLMASREISLREPMQQQSPYAGVVAANDAVAKALKEIVNLTLEHAR
jgi:cholesterol transport system auxiliary component